jgi:hypothetical protein
MMNIKTVVGAVLDRRDLLAWVGNQLTPVVKSIDSADLQLDHDSCVLIWRDRASVQGRGPLIVVADQGLAEFFAFTSTYLPAYTPFSAFFRVLGITAFRSMMTSRETDGVIPHAAIGIAIAEAALAQVGRRTLDRISVSSIRSTLSATLLCAVWQQKLEAPLEEVAARWRTLILATGDRQNRWNLEKFVEVIGIFSTSLLDSSASLPPNMYAALRVTQTEGSITVDAWRLLVSNTPTFAGAFDKLRGPREDRLKAARVVLKDLTTMREKVDQTEAECLAGCIIAMIGDGSFQYLPLALELGEFLPASILWFAAWCALFKSNDILSFSNSVGRRAARDIFTDADLFALPTCDIAIEEWVTVYDRATDGKFHSLYPGWASVEISPCQNALIRMQGQQVDREARFTASSDLQEAIRMLDRTRQLVSRAIGRTSDIDQPGLPYSERPNRR